jgi:hypothetical protein
MWEEPEEVERPERVAAFHFALSHLCISVLPTVPTSCPKFNWTPVKPLGD